MPYEPFLGMVFNLLKKGPVAPTFSALEGGVALQVVAWFGGNRATPPRERRTQNYLPPPPESKIELWVAKSTVDTPNPAKHRKIISTIAFAGSAKIWAPRWW